MKLRCDKKITTQDIKVGTLFISKHGALTYGSSPHAWLVIGLVPADDDVREDGAMTVQYFGFGPNSEFKFTSSTFVPGPGGGSEDLSKDWDIFIPEG